MIYDVIIIGGGPAGLTAAVYAARYKLSAVVIFAEEGGLAATAHKICNFPSYESISGMELMQGMKRQAEALRVPLKNETVTRIKLDERVRVLTDRGEYVSKKLIIATGTKRKKINVKGEEEFYGKGVSYCATCDAAFYRGKNVAVVGGSDASLNSAPLLSEFAEKVFIVCRAGSFRAEPAWVEAVAKSNKIETLFNESLKEIQGEKFVSKAVLESGKELDVEGIFIEAGAEPSHLILKDLGIMIDGKGYIIADKNQRTSIKGVFAAGDITDCGLKQIVTAAAQGATAAYSAYRELLSEKTSSS